MSQWNKKDTAFVMISGGYKANGFMDEGYQVFAPYIGNSLISRLFREICFRLPFLPKRVWYDKRILKKNLKHIIVYDAIITVDYLRWLQQCFPDTCIYFKYENMVGRARHLKPNQIPEGIQIWTYDEYDSEKYNINYYKNYIYYRSYVRPKQKTEYDVFFIGRDKGRGEYLLALEEKMKRLGLRTKFIITSDGKFAKKKSYYQKELNYSEIVEYLTKSRAVLNVVMDNQHGVTLRDAESIFFDLKLITTNRHIVNADFYTPERVFILGEREIDELKDFIMEETEPVDEKLLQKHSIAEMVNEIINDKTNV